METGQLAALAGAIAILVILWPAARRMLREGAPVGRWALVWAGAILAVVLLYGAVLEPLGVGLR